MSNTAALYALQAANYLFPLVVIPYLLRTIGVDGFGEIAFVGSVALVFVAIIEFSFNYTATALIAKQSHDPATISRVYSVVMVAKLSLVACSTVGFAVLTLVVPQLRALWPIALAHWPVLLGEALFPLWLFQGMQRLGFVTVFHLVSRVVTLALLFVFVHSPEDTALAAGIQSIHFVIAGLVAQATARWLLGVRFDASSVRPAFSELVGDSARVFVGNLGGHVYVRLPMVLVGLLASAPMAGAFAVAQRVSGLFSTLVAPVAQSLYPHLCTVAERDPVQLLRLRNKALLGVCVGSTVAVVVLNVAAGWVLARVDIGADASVPGMLLAYSPVIVIIGVNTMLATFVMAAKKYDQFKKTFINAAIVFLVASLPLTYFFEAYGMIVSSFTVEAFVFVNFIRITHSFVTEEKRP